jgi:hypothetical protein
VTRAGPDGPEDPGRADALPEPQASAAAEVGRPLELTLLGRAYCHLCDEMLAALGPLAAARGVAVTVLDVDAPEHAHLEAAWGDLVPVLFAGPPDPGNEVCHYRLDAGRVAAALEGHAGARLASEAKIR